MASQSSACIPRMSLVWVMPAATAVAGIQTTNVILIASSVASVIEMVVWIVYQTKDLRRLCSSPLRLLPFPVRFTVLIVMQLCCIMLVSTQNFHNGNGSATVVAPSAPIVVQHNSEIAAKPDEAVASGSEPAAASGAFIVDADPSTLRWRPQTLSVILPCAEEREYALKTVQSIHRTTPKEVLREIVVVDDGSEPPLTQTVLQPHVQKQYNVRVMRHENTVGLIGAKKTGGDAAVGDILVFFDCHVAPQTDWYQDFFQLIGENYRRLVVPQITALDVTTWSQQSAGGGMAKCYLTWDADFKWFDSNDMYVAVISGGLLGMSRRWWIETGGYDQHMLGWGGENLDQSLRMWLCGGEIVAASNSHVAHMWRLGSDTRTVARYKHVGDAAFNRARAVYAWYGEFAEKLDHYPQFMRSSHGALPWYGNLSNILEVRDRLKCRPFSWFLRRFYHIYEEAGMIPKEVFMLKESHTGQCLKFTGSAGTSGNGFGSAVLTDCSAGNDHRLYWHLGNKDTRKKGKCCSGLRAWNTDQCLVEVSSGHFSTGVCDVSGRNSGQEWKLLENTGELRKGTTCISSNDFGMLASRPCSSLRGKNSKWSRLGAYEPLETRLYNKAQKDHPQIFARLDKQLRDEPTEKDPCGKVSCVHLFSENGLECLDAGATFTADLDSCLPFVYKDSELQSVSDGSCLDMWNDASPETWGITGCHHGNNQKFTWNGKDKYCDNYQECLLYKPVVTG